MSLFVAIVYGAVFASTYRQPIDVQGGVIFYLLAFLIVLAAYGLIRLATWLVSRTRG